MAQLDSDFRFVLRSSGSYGVILFAGLMTESALSNLKTCDEEIAATSDFKGIVLDFSGVTSLSAEVIPALAVIQRTIRKKNIDLRLSGLNAATVEKLDKKGVLRKAELAVNVREALAGFVAKAPDKIIKI
jgi:anti-anti-sigma regulatory factor